MIHIRRAEPSDDNAVGNMLVDSFVYAYGKKRPDLDVPDQRKEDLRNVAQRRINSFVFVAEQDNDLVGTFTIQTISNQIASLKVCEINLLATRPEIQGTGVGKVMVNHAIDWAKKQGFHKMILHVREKIEGLDRYYRSFGFVPKVELDKTVYGGIPLFGYELIL